jgi:hypothetical protein
MAMSLTQLNELLKRAIESLQDERATLVTFVDPTKPLLPESYWQDQYDRATIRAKHEVAKLFERSLDIAHAKAKRRREDEMLANLSVDELLDNNVGALWEPDPHTSWGLMPMKHSGGTLRPPSRDDPQPAYNWECYQCGRPITNSGKDHAGRTRCDAALMPQDYEPYRYHTPKPWHGEEEEDDEDEE